MADQPNIPPEGNATDGDAASFQGFSQDDIDAALSAASGGATESAASPQDEIDAALAAAGQLSAESGASGIDTSLMNEDGTPKLDSQGRPFDAAAAEMAAAIEEERAAAAAMRASQPAPPAPAPLPPPPRGAAPLEIPDFGSNAVMKDDKGIGLLSDVRLDVKIELGRTDLYIEEVLKLGTGSVVELDRLAGDPVDVMVNDRLVARGEVLVLNDNFCVRISEILVGKDER